MRCHKILASGKQCHRQNQGNKSKFCWQHKQKSKRRNKSTQQKGGENRYELITSMFKQLMPVGQYDAISNMISQMNSAGKQEVCRNLCGQASAPTQVMPLPNQYGVANSSQNLVLDKKIQESYQNYLRSGLINRQEALVRKSRLASLPQNESIKSVQEANENYLNFIDKFMEAVGSLGQRIREFDDPSNKYLKKDILDYINPLNNTLYQAKNQVFDSNYGIKRMFNRAVATLGRNDLLQQ